jgi:predicted outer membrane repeat protein
MFDRSGPRASYCLVLLFAALATAPAWAVPGICRVTTAGTPFNDGSSWAAPVSLRQALVVPQICGEIWVAKGVYTPADAGQPQTSFVPNSGVQLYGGFAGGETAREQRDPTLNLTVLSGDIDNNDTKDQGVVSDALDIVGANSWHVVLLYNVSSSTVLDGFTITAGSSGFGGGLYCSAPNIGLQCTPMLSHLVFAGNAATTSIQGGPVLGGGGLYIEALSSGNASPSVTDVEFRGNRGANGGAMLTLVDSGGTATPSLTRVVFTGNTATGSGGGYYQRQGNGTISTSMVQVAFIENTAAAGKGGAISGDGVGAVNVNRAAFVDNSAATDGGAIGFVTNGTSSVSNATFSGNATADEGGAVFNQSGTLTLTNVTMSANQASNYGGAIVSKGGNIVLRDAISWGNLAPLGQLTELAVPSGTLTVDHSIVKGSGGSGAWNAQFGTDGGGNLDADPLLGPLTELDGPTFVRYPATGSPAIDSGANCAAEDQLGVARPKGAQCDMGALEVFSINLIKRSGFEECWSPALTEAVFLQRIRTAIDGTTTCIPAFSGNVQGIGQVTSCTNPDCPGGAVGCPITISASPFLDGGDFAAGQFTATGTANDISVPVGTPFGNCTYTASNITTSYLVDFVFQPDEGSGVYAALLDRFVPTATTLTLTSGNSSCNLAAPSIEPAFKGSAQNAVAAALRSPIEAGTVGQAVCPVE